MKKRLYIIILLMVAFVLPSNAVLKEANLDTTLYMLRTELTNYHIDLEKQNQAAKAQQLAVIQELISIVKQADQNSIMLYSQRNGYIFDMTYACHEATEQFKKFKSKAVPFRQMIKKNNVEVARFDSLINYLYGMNTMFLSEEAQVNRNVDLTLAVNIRRQLVEKQKQLQAYVQAYDRTDTRKFTYNAEDGKYSTNDWEKKVKFQNLIILKAESTYITVPYKGSTTTYLNYKWNSGSGKYISNGTASLGFSKTERINTEGYFSYDRTFGDAHKVNAVLGYSWNRYDGESFSMSNSNFTVDGVKYWDMEKGSYLNDGLASMSSSKEVTEKLMAYFARANYSYRNRYMISATYRREGSSKFGKKNRWGNFWAVSAGWSIANEPFMANVKWIDDLKIRAGYGVTGNNDFSATYSGNFIGADENRWLLPNGTWKYTYGRSEDVNPNLGWESKGEWNVGLDFSFLDGRIYGKADFFRRKISDMLFYVRVPQPPYIRGYQWQNIGSMENKGWEFELGGDIIRTKDFKWSTSLNLSHSSSRVLTMDGSNTRWDGGQMPGPNSPGKSIILEEGSVVGQFYIYEFAGFSSDGQFLISDRNGRTIPASSKIADDRKLLGNFTPKVMYGWSHSLSYRDFDLGVSMHGWLGFDVYNTYAMCLGIARRNGECNVLRDAYTTFAHIKDEKLMSNYYLEEGSFLKIDAITLGYTLDIRRWTKYVDSLRVFATCGNVATFTGYTGLDPEVNITGYDGGIDYYTRAYPMTRTWTLGVQLKF